MKRGLLFFFVALLVFSSTTFISGAKPDNTPKEEVIYGILDSAGDLQSITVVNGFVLEKDATIADYGDYANLQNLSSDSQIQQSGNFITFAGKTGRINYQGDLQNRQLPWKVTIKYYLNGQPVSPAELAGKSGKLKLTVKTTRNSVEKGPFFDDFALQIAVPLNMDLCKNIVTTGATVADNGSIRQYSYVVLPGENGFFSVNADVTDFEMDPITMAGVRMTFDLPLDVDQINQSIDRLVSAAEKLDNGAVGLVKGAKALKAGMEKYTDGFAQLNSKVGQLQSGAVSLQSGISDLGQGLQSLSSQGEALRIGAGKIQLSVFDGANAQLAGMRLPTLTPENYKTVLSALPSSPELVALIQQLDDITAFVAGVEAYTLGTTQLSEGAAALETGAGDLSGGIGSLAEGLQRLYNSAEDLNQGLKSFLEGVSTYQNGTEKFSAGTNKMDQEFGEQLDSLMAMLSNDDKVYRSYVSDDNTNVNFVQFVIKTTGVSIAAEEPAVEPAPAEKNLWEKFLDLFR